MINGAVLIVFGSLIAADGYWFSIVMGAVAVVGGISLPMWEVFTR